MGYIVPFITIVLLVNLLLGDECLHRKCDCMGQEIACSIVELNDIPQTLFNESSSLITLVFYGDQVKTIPAGSLPGNLTEVSLSGTHIATIDDTAFDESIYTLQTLSFSEAQFSEIPGALFHLKVLKHLEIDDTNILTWNEDGMNQLGSTMETLSFVNVGLKSWPTWMKSMTKLTDLKISECSISIIPDDALDIVANSLTSLDLSINGLTALPKSMSKLTILRSLILNHNKIIDVTWLPQLSAITTLFLDNNKITDSQKLSKTLKPFANTLVEFGIQNNSLTSIPDVSFFTQMQYFDFEFNHISDANSGSFPSDLAGLHLDNNLLVSFPSIMRNLKFLLILSLYANNIEIVQGSLIPTCVINLDLTSNSISQLTRSSFPQNSSLLAITLNNNPLSSISPDAFSNIHLLTELNLENTKLTRLPLALSSLTKLTIFDISNNKNLVCTCQEQSLRPWVLSGSFSITEDCGMTSIYYFFEVLISDCPQMT